ncbi:hypothetical protein BCR34DRAFT_198720 [Clohesyomyces aquaticus]|uniref:Uncharacterized protein n=1 Tax=Clohesyomyces aquaticus TaxID=1231657 RepID=A0A1Y1ZXT9_9PLEO|nr:hypothetical protein BCR34DRAFT_198720 [Clohesyomyces aquaticus]
MSEPAIPSIPGPLNNERSEHTSSLFSLWTIITEVCLRSSGVRRGIIIATQPPQESKILLTALTHPSTPCRTPFQPSTRRAGNTPLAQPYVTYFSQSSVPTPTVRHTSEVEVYAPLLVDRSKRLSPALDNLNFLSLVNSLHGPPPTNHRPHTLPHQ